MNGEQPVAVLHVGAMKTGTTYLQNKLLANREHLAANDVDFVGERWRDQVSAVQDLLSLAQHDPAVQQRSRDAWDRLVDDFGAAKERVSLLSMEFLSFADEDAARRAVTSIESETGRQVHVILTVRDTAAVVPALWQTSITSGGLMTWPRFTTVVRASTRAGGRLGGVLARAGVPSARRFSEAIDIPRMLRVWTAVLPPERVHVIVVPGRDAPRDLLWEHFCSVIGIDPASCPEPPQHVNESLGLPSAELVRRINETLRLRHPTEQRTIKMDIARDALSLRRHDERKAQLDPATFKASLRWNGRIRQEIGRTGVHVVGSLEDLPTTGDPASYSVDSEQAEATNRELLRAARTAYRAAWRLNLRLTRQHLKPKRRRRWRRQVKRQLVRPQGWRETGAPVEAAVADISLLVRSAVRLEKLAQRRRRQRRRRRRQRQRGQGQPGQ